MPQWLIRISTPRRSICAHGISWLPTERPLVGGQFYTPTTNAEAKANAVRIVPAIWTHPSRYHLTSNVRAAK